MALSSMLHVESLDSIRTLPGTVIIKPGPENNHIKISSEDGEMKVWIDPSYEPEKHATTFGEVVVSEEGEIQKGDTIFFHYLCCLNAIRDRKYVVCDGQMYYVVNCESCFVAKRGEQIIPLNGTILTEAIIENTSEVNEFGMSIPKAKRDKNSLNEGVVLHAGLPSPGEDITCSEGDVVFWRTGASVPLQYSLFSTFSDKLVYQLKYDFIMGVRK
jgi:hypothetical protein